MGVGAAPAESPPTHARTARGLCGARPVNPDHGRGVRPHPLAVAPSELALTIAPRPSRQAMSPIAVRAVVGHHVARGVIQTLAAGLAAATGRRREGSIVEQTSGVHLLRALCSLHR